MKRLTVLLMTLLTLLTTASADTLREQTGAPETLREQWTSAASPMLITIDATVDIPEVEQICRVAVTRHEFTAEEVERIGTAVIGTPLTGLAYENVYSGWNDQWRCRAQVGDWRLQGGYLVLRGKRMDEELSLWRDNNLSVGSHMSVMNQQQAYENPYIPEAAQAIADELAAVIAPSHTLTAWGTEEQMAPPEDVQQGAYDTQTEFKRYPEEYIFCYTPVTGGIPELYTFEDCTQDEDTTYFPYANDRLYIAVGPEGLSNAYWQSPNDYGERTPCELLPFDQIMNVARELLPLRNAYSPHHAGAAELHVNRVTLSYCRVRKRNVQDGYELIPVWDFFGVGHYDIRGERKPLYTEAQMPYDSLLTVSAIDGLVIDRAYGY